jgi:hypothetical protein
MAPDRHNRPTSKELRSSHLLRLTMVADRVTNGVVTPGLKMSARICRKAGCSWEDMSKAMLGRHTVEEIKDWIGDENGHV